MKCQRHFAAKLPREGVTMASSAGWTFFSSFLDGFTGAGLAGELSVPGEPAIGFAPSPDEELIDRPQVFTADVQDVAFGPANGQGTSRELRTVLRRVSLDTRSGKFTLVTESAGGGTATFEVVGSRREVEEDYARPDDSIR
jgi:hypothetical protein